MSETLPNDAYASVLAQITAEYQERSRLEAEIRPGNQAALFDALASGGVTSVVVVFDGLGDSGQIESIETRTGDVRTPLPDVHITIRQVLADASGVEETTVTLYEAIEALAYDLLEETHPGWENNDGAFGEFIFDVAARTIALDHHERFTDIESFSHAWGE